MPSDKYHVETESATVVAIGQFNPAIFQPQWFARNNLLSPDEMDRADVKMIIQEATVFASGDWLRVEVTQNRFVVASTDPARRHEVRDLAIGTFQVLEHTPLQKLGLNQNQHLKLHSEADWHAFGDHFAPKDSWGAILDADDYRIGLRNMVMWGKCADVAADRIQIQIGPSEVVRPGVSLQINQHYELVTSEDDAPNKCIERFLAILSDDWDQFLDYSSRATDHLFSEAFPLQV